MSIKDENIINKYRKFVESILRHIEIPRGMDVDDLRQEGYLGLLLAAKRYKSDTKIKFTTFAYYYIKGLMLRYIYANKYLEHVPVRHLEFAKMIRDFVRKNPMAEDDKEKLIQGTGLTEKQIKNGLEVSTRASKYVPLTGNEREDSGFIESVADLDRQILRKRLLKLCQLGLTERQREVVYKHYGLIDGKVKSFQDIADELGVSAQRVRACCAAAVKRLYKRKERLKDVHI